MGWLFSICFHDWVEVRKNNNIYYRCRKCSKVITKGELYL